MSEVREEFIFLNRLRESGDTNMFGAAPYLEQAFGMGKREASLTLREWMEWVEQDSGNRDL
jgi:hypothetical protein